MIRTPIMPVMTAKPLYMPSFSPNNGIERREIIKGAVKKIAVVSARESVARGKKKNNMAPTRHMPRIHSANIVFRFKRNSEAMAPGIKSAMAVLKTERNPIISKMDSEVDMNLMNASFNGMSIMPIIK